MGAGLCSSRAVHGGEEALGRLLVLCNLCDLLYGMQVHCCHSLQGNLPWRQWHASCLQALGPRQWMYINVILESSELLVPLPMHEATGMHVLNKRHRQQQGETHRQATPGLMLAWQTLRSALLRLPLAFQAQVQPDISLSA